MKKRKPARHKRKKRAEPAQKQAEKSDLLFEIADAAVTQTVDKTIDVVVNLLTDGV
ncbi:MAG: hypothetical protein KBA31_01895 [Alphaproteobacteria bacterium]|nr:hypothetical protein [Alphaproteobacteria bacterium]